MAVVSIAEEADAVVRWGCRLAAGDDAGLVVLCPQLAAAARESELDSAEPEAMPAAAAVFAVLARVRSGLLDAAGGEALTLPMTRVLDVQGPDLVAAIESAVKTLDADLLLVAKQEKLQGAGADLTLVRQLFRRSPCAVALLRTVGRPDVDLERILVPTAGGPHARVALRWAHRMAEQHACPVTALLVEPTAGEDPDRVGHRLLEKALAEAGIEGEERLDTRVVVDDSVLGAVQRVAAEGYDLIMVGATRHGFVRRMLFGALPSKLAASDRGGAVLVLRAPRSLTSRTLEGMESWLSQRLPQLSRDERVELFESLQTRSRWDVDFVALLGLSTAIAALGLIQSSTAVVIGAMLVAPLMTPLLSSALALVQGNLPLLRTSLRAVGLGFFSAVAIGFGLGVISPLPALTSELLARGSPTLLDLGVALLSGIAAAYATARPNLSAALPGVAIAAALVPPIATVGISLALGEASNAGGAALLFATNVVAIVLGGAVALHALGVRGSGAEGSRLWVRRTVIGLLLTAFLLAFPLASFLTSGLQKAVGPPGWVAPLRPVLEEVLESHEDARLLVVRVESRNPLVVRVEVGIEGRLEPGVARELAEAARGAVGDRVEIRLATVVVASSD